MRDVREADALPASAGAVGLRPHPGGDEPPAYAPTTICGSSSAARGAARHGAVVGFHRRLPRRDRGGFRRDPGPGARGRLRPVPSPSNTARAPARRPRRSTIRCRATVKEERLARLQALLAEQSTALQPAPASAAPWTCCSSGRAAMPASSVGRSPYLQPVHVAAPAALIEHRPAVADRGGPCQFADRRDRRRSEPARDRIEPRARCGLSANSPTTRCCPCCSGRTTPISPSSSERSAWPWPRAAIASPSPAHAESVERGERRARRALSAGSKRGQPIDAAEVDAALRMSRCGKRSAPAQVLVTRTPPDPGRARRCRPTISEPWTSTSWCSASAPPAPARPISPSPRRSA